MKIVATSLAMLGIVAKVVAQAPALPTVTPVVYPYHFAATATGTNDLTSDYSNELLWTNVSSQSYVILRWDPSPGDIPVAYYSVHWWRTASIFTNNSDVGTNRQLTVSLKVPALTNRIIYITSLNATNIRYRPYGGLWNLCGWTNRTLTNPPVGLQYQGMGRSAKSPARVMIYKEVR